MKHPLRALSLAALATSAPLLLHGQAVNAGDIRGTAVDTTGAVIPGVTVTITNIDTGVVKVLTTNQDGLYDTSSIVVGNYGVKAEKQGFSTFERPHITLTVGLSTVNISMKAGGSNEVVEVNSDLPLLTTESGEQSTTFEAKSMAELPNVGGGTGPDWENFTILLPGSAGTPQQSNSSTNPGQVVAINGNLPYSNVLSDGVSTTLSHSQNADVNTFETVAELQINTSAFSAQYGIGGVVFNQITKSGTNQFHGSLYDYFQSDKLNAYNYQFGLLPGQAQKNRLHYNDFGGAIGGPVLIPKLFNGRDKAFFFFNYDQIVNHGTGSNSFYDIPTESVKAGDFTGQPTLYDPLTQTIARDAAGNPYPVRRTFQSEYGTNAIPAALIDKVSANFQKLYPSPTSHIAAGNFVTGNVNNRGVLQQNFHSSLPQSTPYRRYFGRFDYNISAKNHLFMTDQQRDTPVQYPSGFLAQPYGWQFGDVDSNTAQITDVHTFSGSLINEFRFGYTYQGNFYADQALGQGIPNNLGWQFAKADTMPHVHFDGNYPYSWIEPSSNAVYKEHVFDPSDVVTLVRGKHILHFGGEFLMYDDNSTAWGNVNAGELDFNGSYTRQWTVNNAGIATPDPTTGQDYADFLLGTAHAWGTGSGNSPEYGARLKSPQVFVQDDIKLRPNFTLNLGFRYQIRHGWSEVHENMATWDPTIINPANNSLGAIWYGTTHTNGRTQLQADEYKIFLPRAGFSWLPTPTTTLRGGFGIYAYNLSLDSYGGGMGAEFSSTGSYADQNQGITPVVLFGGNGTNLQTGQPLPYTAATTDPARFNGQSTSANPYHTPTPQIYQYNMALQHTLGNNMVFELAYVGSHGLNLSYPTELTAAPLNHLTPNNNQYRPYPLFQSVSSNSYNAVSNYNSLQASVQRRLAKGLSFDANYTWAHFLDSIDSSGWGSRSGNQNYQIANRPDLNYSNSNFDVRNAFKGRVLYQLPFGRGRMFMNKSIILDEILGGYQVSSTMIFQSGNPFTVTVNGSDTYQHAGSMFPNLVGLNPFVGGKTYQTWVNPTAFTFPGNGNFGNLRRNQLYGPGVELVNISAGKTFDIHEAMKLEIRADATNAFNHANFGAPGGGVLGLNLFTNQQAGQAFSSAATTRQINGVTNNGRNMQLAARFTF